jgi:hypothetical protein
MLKNNFEVYKVSPTGTRTLIQTADDFRIVFASTFDLVTAKSGRYIVRSPRDTDESTIELADFETVNQDVTVPRPALHRLAHNRDYQIYSGRAEEFSAKDYWFAAREKFRRYKIKERNIMSTPGIKLEDLQYAEDEPTHEEIQKRAYELYLDKRNSFRPLNTGWPPKKNSGTD